MRYLRTLVGGTGGGAVLVTSAVVASVAGGEGLTDAVFLHGKTR